jgi:hypothetical protein
MYPEWVPVFIMAWSIVASRVPSVWGTGLLGVAERGCVLESNSSVI